MSTAVVSDSARLILPEELRPNVEHLVTEDDTPVDGFFSEKQMRLLTEPLHSSWGQAGKTSPFVAAANVGLFYAIRQPPFVPDVLLSLDVSLPPDVHPKPFRSYFVWEYGKAPDVVIEIVSNNEGGEDTEKLVGYARVGVRYYAIFDPDTLLSREVLRVFQLEGRSYRPVANPAWLPDVGLGLQIWQGTYEDFTNTWLRWVDAKGQPIPTGSERAAREKARADAEYERAELERQRAEQLKQRAESEQQRAERLAEQLRRLGMEPDAVE